MHACDLQFHYCFTASGTKQNQESQWVETFESVHQKDSFIFVIITPVGGASEFIYLFFIIRYV